MKTLILFILTILFLVFIAKVSHYSERMTQLNKQECAVWGYEEDCKTKLR